MASENVSVLVAHDIGLAADWVAAHLPREEGVSIERMLDSLSANDHVIRASDAQMLVVACSVESDDALNLVRWWSEHRPERPVIVLCRESPNGFVQRAFAAGADDLVVLEPGLDVSAESVRNVGFALQKVLVRKSEAAERRSQEGNVICILGPKGGVGKTVTACNLALSLIASRKKVVLMDLDLQFGDVALALGLRPDATIHDLIVSGGSLDTDKLEAYLTRHHTGLRVLAAPVRPDQADMVTPQFAADVIAMLRTVYDFVVIDTPPSFGPEVIAAIDVSTDVCMVGMLDASSLKNTRLGLETLELMGYPGDHVRVVLNRANTSVGITGRDVVEILGKSPDVLVPSSRDLARSVNEGEPIVLSQGRSESARAFTGLADLFAPPTRLIKPKRRRRMFRKRSAA